MGGLYGPSPAPNEALSQWQKARCGAGLGRSRVRQSADAPHNAARPHANKWERKPCPNFLISVAALSFFASAESAFAEDVQAGGDLFNDNCAICHGNKGQGYPKEVVPDGAVRIKKLAGDSAYWDFAVFKKAVLDGKDDHDRPMRVMPVFAKDRTL